jgi:transcription elongation factor Elf1
MRPLTRHEYEYMMGFATFKDTQRRALMSKPILEKPTDEWRNAFRCTRCPEHTGIEFTTGENGKGEILCKKCGCLIAEFDQSAKPAIIDG